MLNNFLVELMGMIALGHQLRVELVIGCCQGFELSN